MSDADFKTDGIGQRLQVMFEYVLVRGVAPAAITHQKDRGRSGIALLSNPVPIPTQTVTGEQAGVVRQSNVDVSTIANAVVDPMRDDHAVGPTGKVMIECVEGPVGANPTGPEQVAQMLLALESTKK